MPERITVEVVATPLPAVVAQGFFVTAQILEDLGEPTRQAAAVLANEIEQNFRVGGRPAAWPPLAEATIKRKGHGRILFDSNDLFDEATNPSNFEVTTAKNTSSAHLDAEQLPEYAIFHVTGTEFMPERDFTFVSDEAIDEIEKIYANFLDDAIAAGD